MATGDSDRQTGTGDSDGSRQQQGRRERREAIIRKFKRRGENEKNTTIIQKKLTIRKDWMIGQQQQQSTERGNSKGNTRVTAKATGKGDSNRQQQ